MTHSMLRALAERCHDVRVQVFRRSTLPGQYQLQGVQVWPAQLSARTPSALAADADVVVSHLEGVPYVKQAAAIGGVPVVAICHNTHAATFEDASGVDLAIYNSRWMRAAAKDFYGAGSLSPPRRTLVVRPPVVAEDYATPPGDRVTLVNLNENKGAELFWALAERMPDVQFLGVRGSYGDQIVRDLPNVQVLDPVPGTAMRDQVYARTRVLLAPSAYESWGRVAAEAAASGIPTIAHPTPGLSECLGRAGRFVDRADVDSWEKALRQLVAEPSAWAKASAAARARSAALDPAAELARWCRAVEEVAG
ncbi:glycosyltransferase family 4 protein [Streptomyces noursei]|uniref:glycosyltransferase family 4 protein n=1 Tax=Streptomyces noursei TaxID=1971 RepID=UPI0023B7C9F9|nr:glycosyltransferase family 4 protein [Streptomyces noursei]